MDQFVKGLIDEVGLNQETAEKVFDFVKEHWGEVPRWVARAVVSDREANGFGELVVGNKE